MSVMLIGYARCSTDRRDLAAQRKALRQLGVDNKQIYVDRGLAGTPPRPGLEKALASRAPRRHTGGGTVGSPRALGP